MPAMVRAAFSAAFLWGWLLEALASRSTRYISSAASSSLEAIFTEKAVVQPFFRQGTDVLLQPFLYRIPEGGVAGIVLFQLIGEPF